MISSLRPKPLLEMGQRGQQVCGTASKLAATVEQLLMELADEREVELKKRSETRVAFASRVDVHEAQYCKSSRSQQDDASG